jgi:hypothetical protein
MSNKNYFVLQAKVELLEKMVKEINEILDNGSFNSVTMANDLGNISVSMVKAGYREPSRALKNLKFVS